ncbi:hypothetical protein [Nonomuraea rubra]|uniref:hypothetical protein n=1 Tax=Nonomuraea rubra TaxID=46180 RepID=UPI00340DCE13
MEWWKLGLEYLKVLAGWPIIILALAVVLRKHIGGLLRRDLEAEAAGVRVRVGRAEEAAEQALEEATQLSLVEPNEVTESLQESDGQEQQPRDSSSELPLTTQVQVLEAQLKLEEDRRSALERVLSEGARLGWEWAKSGEIEPPELSVVWSDEGTPRVQTEREARTPGKRSSVGVRAHAYEKRIFTLLQEHFPGSVLRAHMHDSPVNAYINLEGQSLHIVVKFRQDESQAANVGMIRSMLDRMRPGPEPVLIVANFGTSRAAKELMQNSYFLSGRHIYWVEWHGSHREKQLVEAVENILFGGTAQRTGSASEHES